MAKPSDAAAAATTPRLPHTKQTTLHRPRPGPSNMPATSQSTRPPKRFRSVASDDGASGPVTSANFTAPHKRTMAFASPVRRPPSRDLGYNPRAASASAAPSDAHDKSRSTSVDAAPVAPLAPMAPMAPIEDDSPTAPIEDDAPKPPPPPTPQPEVPEEPASIGGVIWNSVRSAFGGGGGGNNATPDPTSPSVAAGRKRAFNDIEEAEEPAADAADAEAPEAEPIATYSATVTETVVETEGPAGETIVATEETVVEEVEVKANSTAVEPEDQLRDSLEGAVESPPSVRDVPAGAEVADDVETKEAEVNGEETEHPDHAAESAVEEAPEETAAEETDKPKAETPVASEPAATDDASEAEAEANNGENLQPMTKDGAEVFEIEDIVEHRQATDDETLFEVRVKWDTEDPKDQFSWEPEANVQEDAPAALWKYWRSVKGGRAAAMADPDMWHVLHVAGHKVQPDGGVLLHVAWIGSAQKSWEPEDAVRGYGAEHLDEYWATQGGRATVLKGAKTKAAKTKVAKTKAGAKTKAAPKVPAKKAAAKAAAKPKPAPEMAPQPTKAAATAAPTARVPRKALAKAAPVKPSRAKPAPAKAAPSDAPATRPSRAARTAEPVEEAPAPAKRKATATPRAAPPPKKAKEAPPPARSTRSRRT
ncbi:hypothetical protein VDGD_03608 [Verticillium dahliae]|nr:hypothetical protein VDGD_03608 [Verticillium dahliae]